MGVDHGLGGKNSEKSRTRRQKRAKQVASIAKAALGKKKEVVFDDESRVSYLTGFRKRKQERREYGHAMEIMKTHKKKLDKRKELRIAVNHAMEERAKEEKKSFEDVAMQEEEGEEEEEEDVVTARTTFADEATTAMFGGAVSVVVDTGIAEEMDRTFQENIAPVHKPPKNAKKEPTRLEKALTKARHNMHNAPKKKKPVAKQRGAESATGLLQKAVGSHSRAGRKEKKKEQARGKSKGKGFRK